MRTRRWGEKALLELNQFMPLIAHCFLNSIELLSNACRIFAKNCIIGIQANRDRCAATLESSTALVTALAEEIGYERAADIAQQAIQTRRSIREIVTSSGLMNDEQFDQMISPARVTRLGNSHRKREKHE